jgi:hypothetical protein
LEWTATAASAGQHQTASNTKKTCSLKFVQIKGKDMEISGYNEQGKLVKAEVSYFAADNAQEGETFAGFGSSMNHVRYKNQEGKVTREVNVQEMATQGGLRDVAVKFNPNSETYKKWKKDPREGIDQGVAYGVDRLGSDEAKKSYLSEKGYTNFFQDGDDFYSINDGNITPINNKPGIDLADLTRLTAKAGRDLVGGAAASASVLSSGLTGPIGILGAATAGATGAVGGETLQRMADDFIDPSINKARVMSGGAAGELQSAGMDVGAGAIGGVMDLGLSKIPGAFRAAKSGAEEAYSLAKNAAADFIGLGVKKESGLARQIPNATKEARSVAEVEAQSLLKNTSRPNTVSKVEKQASEIAKGRAKPTGESVVDSQQNEMLTQAMAQRDAAAKTAQEAEEGMLNIANLEKSEMQSTYRIGHEKNAKEALADTNVDVEEIFKQGGKKSAANKEILKVEAMLEKQVGKGKDKITFTKDPITGRITGVDADSVLLKTANHLEETASELSRKVDQTLSSALKFKSAPDINDSAKADNVITAAIKKADKALWIGSDGTAVKTVLNQAKDVVSSHSLAADPEDVAEGMIAVLSQIRTMSADSTIPSSARRALADTSDALFTSVQNVTPAKLWAQARNEHLQSITMQEFLKSNKYKESEHLFQTLEHLDKAAGIIGRDKSETSKLAFLHALPGILEGATDSTLKSMMGEAEKRTAKTLVGVRNLEKLGVNKVDDEGTLSKILKPFEKFTTVSATKKALEVAGGAMANSKITAGAKAVGKTAIKASEVRAAAGAEESLANKIKKQSRPLILPPEEEKYQEDARGVAMK